MIALAHRGGRLFHPERHLARFLAENGFESVLAGMSHVGPDEPCGYTRISTVNRSDGDAITENAVDFLKNRDPKRPFFLDAGFYETHRTGSPCHGFSQPGHSPGDGDGDPSRVMPPAPLPDTPETRRDWLDYIHAVERLDSYYGRILAALDAAGLRDDTLVLATSDHGPAFPFQKCHLTGHGTGVLFILRAPGAFAGGNVSDALVSHLDFYPTLCELLGLKKPAWLQGQSLVSIANGTVKSLHDAIFSEVTFHAAFEPKRGVRTARWNYIRNFSAPCPPALANCDDGLSKRLLVASGFADRIVPAEELYDLMLDPQESDNLAADPGHAALLAEFRARLDCWMRDTADPLLSADVSVLPLPQTVNTREQREPDLPTTTWNPAEWDLISHHA